MPEPGRWGPRRRCPNVPRSFCATRITLRARLAKESSSPGSFNIDVIRNVYFISVVFLALPQRASACLALSIIRSPAAGFLFFYTLPFRRPMQNRTANALNKVFEEQVTSRVRSTSGTPAGRRLYSRNRKAWHRIIKREPHGHLFAEGRIFGLHTRPDLTPYVSQPSKVSLTQVTSALASLSGSGRRAALRSKAINFSVPDAAPEDKSFAGIRRSPGAVIIPGIPARLIGVWLFGVTIIGGADCGPARRQPDRAWSPRDSRSPAAGLW